MKSVSINFLVAGTAILMLFAIISPADAQTLKSGDLSALKDEEKINMVCNFDNCTIDKKPAKGVIARTPEWNDGVKEIIKRFDEGQANTNNKTVMQFGDFPEARYTLVYDIVNINDDQNCKGSMRIIDNQTNTTIAEIEKANGEAGMFGSFFNLLGDAFEDLGEKIGKLIKHSLKG